jgi:hypothetical protein
MCIRENGPRRIGHAGKRTQSSFMRVYKFFILLKKQNLCNNIIFLLSLNSTCKNYETLSSAAVF